MDNDIVILGTGNGGRVLLDTCEDVGVAVAGFLCGLKPKGTRINDVPVLGDYSLLDDQDFLSAHAFLVSIADVVLRRTLAEKIRANGGSLKTLVHPSCKISPSAFIGEGTVLHGFNSVRTGSVIGDFVIVDDHTHIGNDIRIGDGTYVAPGCVFTSNSRVGADCFIGVGTVVIPDVSIGDRCLIGAGSVVVADIPAGKVAAGNPARVMRDHVIEPVT